MSTAHAAMRGMRCLTSQHDYKVVFTGEARAGGVLHILCVFVSSGPHWGRVVGCPHRGNGVDTDARINSPLGVRQTLESDRLIYPFVVRRLLLGGVALLLRGRGSGLHCPGEAEPTETPPVTCKQNVCHRLSSRAVVCTRKRLRDIVYDTASTLHALRVTRRFSRQPVQVSPVQSTRRVPVLER